MRLESNDFLLYLVTDRRWLKNEYLKDVVEKAIENGVTFIQLREKDLNYNEFKKLALEVKNVADEYRIPFVINDNVEVARDIDAAGVHIGQGDIPIEKAREILGEEKILGVSASNMKEAIDAERKGANYLGVGAIFPTSSKDTQLSVNLDELKHIKEKTKIPIVAIGGINHKNIHLLEESGIDGVAVISAILANERVDQATKDLRSLADKYIGGK